MTPANASPWLLDLSAELAGHLAIAVRRHRQWAAGSALAVPHELADLESVLSSRATRGQPGTPLEDLWRVRDREVVNPRLLTYTDAGRLLSCSERTVKRLVAAGELTAVHVGGAARVAVANIDEFITRQTAAAQATEGETSV